MDGISLALMLAALAAGTVHTLAGPDHYLPFLALARSRRWSLRRTLAVTLLCGAGHIASSLVLGLLAAGAGWAVAGSIEAQRGRLAVLLLIAFGVAYGAWGLWQARRRRPHEHAHAHADGTLHVHRHGHEDAHVHPHGTGASVWVLFVVFLLGPCEPLVPLIMAPVLREDWAGAGLVAGIFGAATLASMAGMVTAGWFGVRAVRLGPLERYVHALAGGVLALSGVAVLVFDL